MSNYSSLDHNLFIKNFTRESVYLLGFIWADGYFPKYDNSIHLSIQQNDGIEIEKYIDRTGNWNKNWNRKLIKYPTWKTQVRFTVRSKELRLFLKDFNYFNRENSTDIFKIIPSDLHHYWYLGFLDGDGCWYVSDNIKYNRTRNLIFSGPYNQNWNFIIEKLNKLNCNYILQHAKNLKGKSSLIKISKYNNIYKIGEYLYQDKSFTGLSRKYQKYIKLISSYKKITHPSQKYQIRVKQ